MSHFYGTLEGNRGEATRCGSKASGMRTHTAGWHGAIQVSVWRDTGENVDRYSVYLTPWQYSGGKSIALASGILDASLEGDA